MMVSSRGGRLQRWASLLLVVNQMASLAEAGKPFYGYGDDGGGALDYQPLTKDHIKMQCNIWPVLSPGNPPGSYGEYASSYQGPNSKTNQQWVYACVVGNSGVPAPNPTSYENSRAPQYAPQPPILRQARSGSYMYRGGPPQFRDYFNVPMSFPMPITTPYEQSFRDFQPPMGIGDWVNGGLEAARAPMNAMFTHPAVPVQCPFKEFPNPMGVGPWADAGLEAARTSMKSSFAPPTPPGQWNSDEDFEHAYPPLPELQVFTNPPRPSLPMRRGDYGQRPPMGYYQPPSQNSQQMQNGLPGQGQDFASRLNSTGPVQFIQMPQEDATTARPTPPPVETREYTPYSRYGLQLIG